MKSTTTKYHASTSTYALLVRAEQEERSAYEAAVYMLLMFCTVFSIWQAAHQPFQLPTFAAVNSSAKIAQSSITGHQQGV